MSRPLRTFAVFFFGGIVVTTLAFALGLVANLIWVDVLHHNPHRTRENVILMMILSPLYGVFLALALMLLALLVQAGIAMLAQALLHRVPLWLLVLALPVSAYAVYLQGNFLLPASGEEGQLSFEAKLLWFSAYTLPSMLACWWFNGRRSTGRTRRLNIR